MIDEKILLEMSKGLLEMAYRKNFITSSELNKAKEMVKMKKEEKISSKMTDFPC